MGINRLCRISVFLDLWTAAHRTVLAALNVFSHLAITLTQDAPTLSEYEVVSWDHLFDFFLRLRRGVREMVNSENTPEKNLASKPHCACGSQRQNAHHSHCHLEVNTKQTHETASWQFCAFARSCFKMCTETT